MLRPQPGAETDQRIAPEREEDVSPGTSLAGLDPGGLCPFHHDVGLGRPMTSPRSPMMSPNVLDVLEAVVCQVARVAGS
jgi:hypothetical protein